MKSPFRENAVQTLANSGESRERTALVTPRRALVALAVIALLLAALHYVAVTSLATPVAGIGWADGGGFITTPAPAAGEVVAPKLRTGTRFRKGEAFGTLTTSEGVTTELEAPGDAIVMQRGKPMEPFTVNEGDPVATFAMMTEPVQLILLLPGAQATGFTEGDLVVGAAVWVQPANGPSFECSIVAFNKYEQPGEAMAAYIPSPSVARFAQIHGSVLAAGASCPEDEIAALLVGAVVPVSVEVGRRSLLSYVFGGS